MKVFPLPCKRPDLRVARLAFSFYVYEHPNKVPFLIAGGGVRALASVGRKNGGSNQTFKK